MEDPIHSKSILPFRNSETKYIALYKERECYFRLCKFTTFRKAMKKRSHMKKNTMVVKSCYNKLAFKRSKSLRSAYIYGIQKNINRLSTVFNQQHVCLYVMNNTPSYLACLTETSTPYHLLVMLALKPQQVSLLSVPLMISSALIFT